MPAPALRIPLSLSMDDFEKNIQSAKSLTSDATQFIVKKFIDMNATVIASGGAAGQAVLGYRALLGVLGPLSLAVTGVAAVFQVMGYATELAKQKIEEFNELAKSAASANVSTDFFQRVSKAAEQLKVDVDDVTDALSRFNDASKDKLGGSDLSRRIEQLSDFGNLKGNSGVGAVAGASDTEAKLRATVDLINQALDSGQRLAALDLAEKAFGPGIAENLRQDSGFLTEMLATADRIRQQDIISQEQIGQAIELKDRLDEAQKVLAEKFKPIQDDLAQLGVNYQASWVDIVQVLAQAVTYANDLYAALKRIPEIFADLGNSSAWKTLTEISGRLGLNSDPHSLGLTLPGEAGFATNDALAGALRNPNNVRRAMQQAIDVQTAVRGDTSKAQPKEEDDSRDQFEIAIDQINKHIATLNADTAAVFQNNAARQQLRAEFQALTAIMRDDGEVTQQQIDAYEKLRASMSAQQALEAAGISLTREHEAAFLAASNGIRQAAQAYDTARDSLTKINSASATLGGALSTAFADAVVEGKSLNDVLSSLVKTLEKAGINSVFSSFFNAPSSGGLSPFASLLGGIIPGFADGTDSAPGGLAWVGERGPELVNLPKGAQVIPNALARSIQGGDTIQNTFMVAGDVTPGTIERLQAAVVAAHRKVDGLARSVSSTQRLSATGVG
ncbi:hypothetical protein [Bradyrhizobium lablabi]|uniref:hypothetical protein n=1 Tax=Bradyrhizobium lablabi TaxID=722472 RepID=UPI00201255D2|nr:hypothetical protein [Bradyrhizobium lablabi]